MPLLRWFEMKFQNPGFRDGSNSFKGHHTRMNCTAVPLQSPASRSAHWVGMDNKFRTPTGFHNESIPGILDIICGTPLGFNHRGDR